MIEERRFSEESLFGIHVYFTRVRERDGSGASAANRGRERANKREKVLREGNGKLIRSLRFHSAGGIIMPSLLRPPS